MFGKSSWLTKKAFKKKADSFLSKFMTTFCKICFTVCIKWCKWFQTRAIVAINLSIKNLAALLLESYTKFSMKNENKNGCLQFRILMRLRCLSVFFWAFFWNPLLIFTSVRQIMLYRFMFGSFHLVLYEYLMFGSNLKIF